MNSPRSEAVRVVYRNMEIGRVVQANPVKNKAVGMIGNDEPGS